MYIYVYLYVYIYICIYICIPLQVLKALSLIEDRCDKCSNKLEFMEVRSMKANYEVHEAKRTIDSIVSEHDENIAGEERLCKAVRDAVSSFQVHMKAQGMAISKEKVRMLMKMVEVEILKRKGEGTEAGRKNLRALKVADKRGFFRMRLWEDNEGLAELEEKVIALEGIEGFVGF